MDKLIPVANHALLQSDMDEIGGQVDCHIQMTDALRDLQRLVKRSHRAAAEKKRLLEQIEHIYHHLRGPVDTMLQDVKGRCN